MHSQIFVNLAVTDLKRSRAFFESLGLAFNPQFSNDHGACLILGENIFSMLLTKDFFQTFTSKDVADSTNTAEALICLSCASRGEVDALVAKAVKAGGKAHREPQDHGHMYGHGFEDLDGHIWELSYMDMSCVPKEMALPTPSSP